MRLPRAPIPRSPRLVRPSPRGRGRWDLRLPARRAAPPPAQDQARKPLLCRWGSDRGWVGFGGVHVRGPAAKPLSAIPGLQRCVLLPVPTWPPLLPPLEPAPAASLLLLGRRKLAKSASATQPTMRPWMNENEERPGTLMMPGVGRGVASRTRCDSRGPAHATPALAHPGRLSLMAAACTHQSAAAARTASQQLAPRARVPRSAAPPAPAHPGLRGAARPPQRRSRGRRQGRQWRRQLGAPARRPGPQAAWRTATAAVSAPRRHC
jgi:hypothetical protein